MPEYATRLKGQVNAKEFSQVPKMQHDGQEANVEISKEITKPSLQKEKHLVVVTSRAQKEINVVVAGTSERRPLQISRPNHHCLRWAVSDGGPIPPC